MPKCLFCDYSGRLSKEHVWPRWIGKAYPKSLRTARDMSHTITVGYADGAPIPASGRIARPGDSLSHTLKCVCTTCNTGWMNFIEQEAKKYLEPCIRGQYYWHYGNKDAHRAILNWVILRSKIIEQLYKPHERGLPVEQIEECIAQIAQRNSMFFVSRVSSSVVYASITSPGTYMNAGFNHLTHYISGTENNVIFIPMGTAWFLVCTGNDIEQYHNNNENLLAKFGFYRIDVPDPVKRPFVRLQRDVLDAALTVAFFNIAAPRREAVGSDIINQTCGEK